MVTLLYIVMIYLPLVRGDFVSIRIIVDSGSNFTAEEVEQYDLGWIPLHIIYPDGRVIEDIPERHEDLYDDIARGILSTSQPTPEQIRQVFEETLSKYRYGVYISLSSVLSGTYNTAKIVVSEMKTDRIKVIDSKQITVGIDTVVMAMLDEISSGVSFDRIEDIFNSIRGRQRFYFMLETLDHLVKSGRIGRARYVVGSILKILPLLVIDEDGYINAMEKVRGGAKKILQVLKRYIEENPPSRHSYMHVVLGRPRYKGIIPFADMLKEQYGAKIKLVRPLTGVHVGIWGVGVSYLVD